MDKIKEYLENQIATYINDRVYKWFLQKAHDQGLTESALLRTWVMEKYAEENKE